jgi:hypothetical protein
MGHARALMNRTTLLSAGAILRELAGFSFSKCIWMPLAYKMKIST